MPINELGGEENLSTGDRRGDKGSWRARLKEAVEAALLPRALQLPRPRSRGAGLAVENVEVVDLGGNLTARIYFRRTDRPECLFGYEWAEERILKDPAFADYPEGVANIIVANFQERIEAADAPPLPSDCDPTGVTWIV